MIFILFLMHLLCISEKHTHTHTHNCLFSKISLNNLKEKVGQRISNEQRNSSACCLNQHHVVCKSALVCRSREEQNEIEDGEVANLCEHMGV